MSKNVELDGLGREMLCRKVSFPYLQLVTKNFLKRWPVEHWDKDCVRKIRILKCVEAFF